MRSRVLLALAALQGICGPASAASPPPPGADPAVAALSGADTTTIAHFWNEVQAHGSPLIHPVPGQPGKVFVTFVARGIDPISPPEVFGIYDWGHLKAFAQVSGTDIWTSTVVLPDSVRSAYWLAWPRGRTPDPRAVTTQRVPGAPTYELFDDPLAGRHAAYFDSTSRSMGRYSWFEGPAAAPQPFLAERPEVSKGTVVTRAVTSKRLQNSRMISVYTPAHYDPRRRGGYDLVVLFDREEFLSIISAATLLDNMIAARAIPPVIAVFISAIADAARNAELPGNEAFQAFVHDELLPPLGREFAITSRAERSVIAGASYGGLCATLTALRYPDRFGKVLSQSGAFWWGPGYVLDEEDDSDTLDRSEAAKRFAIEPRVPLRFYMSVGLLEGGIMVQPNRHLHDVLVAKGYPVQYEELQSGHDWISWRGSLPRGLIALLGQSVSATSKH